MIGCPLHISLGVKITKFSVARSIMAFELFFSELSMGEEILLQLKKNRVPIWAIKGVVSIKGKMNEFNEVSSRDPKIPLNI
ncbi:hypothetical protein AYI68_g5096 [Smittium mucronatum]|uniref:Uncharacterized protein n=1 Tax=Smittium mucronatum TaxID=133383 RepID=A0A1R0GV82_9FUNG|nr:hypothetical protein AYI68_g5096 [Smittium mucronatum]